MKKKIALILTMFMVLGQFAGCTNTGANSPNQSATNSGSDNKEAVDSNANKASDEDAIKIGVIYEASGSLEDWGTQEIRGIELGFEYATEGTMTLNGKPVKLYIEDSASDASIATEKAIKLCETYNVDVLCGSTNTAVAQAVQTIALQYKVPYFVGCAAGDGICGSNYNDYTFMIGRNVSQVARALAVSLKDLGNNFALMFADYAGGHQFGDAYKEAILEMGGNIVYEEYPPLDCPDFTSYLMAVKQTKPDALVIACTGNSFETILPSQFNELGISKLFPLVADVSDTQNLRALGFEAVGMRGCCLYYPTNYDTPENKWLVEKHQEKYNETVEFWSGNGFTLSLAICTALEKAGSTEAEDIIAAAENMSYRGVRGDYQVRPEDHVSLQILPVIELQDTGLEFPEPVAIELLTPEETAPPIRNK